jgi:hypothetical protein
MSEQVAKGWQASTLGRLAQAMLGALLIGWITEASSAELLLMFMVLSLHLDVHYG